MNPVVKRCPKCGVPFSLDTLLHDEHLEVIGMLQVPGAPELTSYYFNHLTEPCNTTFIVPVRAFEGLVDEPIPSRHLAAGEDGCQGHCHRIEDLSLCGSSCSNAPYRRFMLQVLLRPRSRH